jgi:hypothetical protein
VDALRTIKVDSPNIALGDPASKFQVTLEIQDKNDGQDTDKIDVYVSFKITHQNGKSKLKYYLNLFLLQLLQLEQEITIYCCSCNYC